MTGEVLLAPGASNRIDSLRETLLTAYTRAARIGKRREQLGRTQLVEALAAAEAAFAIKSIVGHGKWDDWQKANLRGVASKTLREWMWLYKRRAHIGDAANLAQAKRNIKAAEAEAERKALREPGALPEGKFNLVAIDVPWWFKGKWLRYEVMEREEVLALMRQLQTCLAEDAVGLFWVPDAFVPDVFSIIEAAGFEYARRMIVWVKTQDENASTAGGAPHHMVPGKHELCAIATRGKPLFDPGLSTVFHASPSGRRHSEKPDKFFDLAERLVPSHANTRLELFARKQRPGWQVWGDQCPVEASEGGALLPARAAAAKSA